MVIIIFFLGCKPTGTMNCPPKVIYYKHPEKFYPDAIKTTNKTISNVINVLDKVKDSANIVVTQTAQALKSQLNQFGALSSELIKNAFISSNSRPCDAESSKRLNDLIAKTGEQNFEIQRLVKDPNATSVMETKNSLDSLSKKLITYLNGQTSHN
jgi:hypothetical protein